MLTSEQLILSARQLMMTAEELMGAGEAELALMVAHSVVEMSMLAVTFMKREMKKAKEESVQEPTTH